MALYDEANKKWDIHFELVALAYFERYSTLCLRFSSPIWQFGVTGPRIEIIQPKPFLYNLYKKTDSDK